MEVDRGSLGADVEWIVICIVRIHQTEGRRKARLPEQEC